MQRSKAKTFKSQGRYYLLTQWFIQRVKWTLQFHQIDTRVLVELTVGISERGSIYAHVIQTAFANTVY